MPPRPTKRPRIERSEEIPVEDEASASHLVSFLTGYDSRRDDREEGSSDEEGGAGGSDGGDDIYEEDLDDEDGDEDSSTPIKRSKHGLVGSRNERSPSTRTTPKKTPTRRTPRKAVSTPVQQEDMGFIRSSKADAYFLAHSRASRTSGNSYSSLVKPLSQAEYERYASGMRGKGKSRDIVDGLIEDLAQRFDQWQLEVESGFDLLFYGYGSKRRLLNRFVERRLSRLGHCVVVNGHYPGMSIRDIIAQIEDALSIPQDIPTPSSATTPLERSAHRIYAYFLPPEAIPSGKRRATALSPKPLLLTIHNIDAAALRTSRSMGVLTLLASSPRIHIVASFDHLHTPLLFSSTSLRTGPHTYAPGSWNDSIPPSRGFNWAYHNATTYDDYDLELSYQRLSASNTLSDLGGTGSGGISEEGALQILRSVPPMALRLLKLLLTKQLSALPPNPASHVAHPAGQIPPVFAIDNDILQTLAKEKFIAREEERYNSLMGEFKDHGLVVEALLDGEGRQGRWVWVPLGKAALERVAKEMGAVEA